MPCLMSVQIHGEEMAVDDRGSCGREDQRCLHSASLLRWIHKKETEPDQEDFLRSDPTSQGEYRPIPYA